MATTFSYNPQTREVKSSLSLRDKRYLIYVWGEEGDGYLTQVKFGCKCKVETHATHDPKKGMRMPLKKAFGLLARLDEHSMSANLVCFPEVIVY